MFAHLLRFLHVFTIRFFCIACFCWLLTCVLHCHIFGFLWGPSLLCIWCVTAGTCIKRLFFFKFIIHLCQLGFPRSTHESVWTCISFGRCLFGLDEFPPHCNWCIFFHIFLCACMFVHASMHVNAFASRELRHNAANKSPKARTLQKRLSLPEGSTK